MEHQPPGSAKTARRRASARGRLLVLAGLGLLLIVAGLGGWAYLKFKTNMAGLEGTWRESSPHSDPRHTYQFRANGDMDAWYEGLPMGPFMTWQRDGQQITVRTTRGWDFVGQLDGDEIRGKVLMRDVSGATVGTTDTVWRKE